MFLFFFDKPTRNMATHIKIEEEENFLNKMKLAAAVG